MNSVNIDFSIKVEELSFSVRTENCLIADGIRVLGDLVIVVRKCHFLVQKDMIK